jgi:hypothetical protein
VKTRGGSRLSAFFSAFLPGSSGPIGIIGKIAGIILGIRVDHVCFSKLRYTKLLKELLVPRKKSFLLPRERPGA